VPSGHTLGRVGVSSSKEPDTELAESIARRGCILRGLVGSTVHGLANPGTDDRDEMGVCVEPPQYIAGLRPFEHWVYRTQPEGAPSGPGDLDLTIYGLRKYCRMALKGSPTVLLLLFIDGEHVLQRDPLGQELQALAPAFVSKRAGRAFLGYVDAQRRGLIGTRHATRTRELSSEHGYDTKYAMHALRIAHQGQELLRTGRITLPIASPEREDLMQVRRGEIPLRSVLDRLHERSALLEDTILSSDLPDEPDRDAVDRFLVDAYQRAWAGETGPSA
jgi:predicted nucleotidyltransferase